LLNYSIYLTGGLSIQYKKIIYNQIYLPTVLYLNNIWYSELPNYLAYSTTNSVKLLNLIEQLQLNKEAQVELDGFSKSKEEKSKIKNEKLIP
jgi:hypothetical protein